MPSPQAPQGFDGLFEQLTGNLPFPWQRKLHRLFVTGDFRAVCDIPTGLGKTSVIYLWLLARAVNPTKVPLRLVYVVNRRTVVDQASDEARRLRDKLESSLLGELRVSVSTLRGELADSGDWWKDPSRPAVVIGTIDLIGSALLFSSYRAGMKHRPFHAGLLGQDTLLIHDEAHLSKPFQELLTAIEAQQGREKATLGKPFRVMALTATPNRNSVEVERFKLTPEDHTDERVRKRLDAKKGIGFYQVGGEKAAVAEKVAELALRYKDREGLAILVFVRTLDDIERVAAQIRRAKVGDDDLKVLTGTIRGYERDQLVDTAVFKRFLAGEKTAKNNTVYLLANSAGEVGIDISADHLVCDLTPYESMAQRFGRVNRRGDGNADIDIVHEPIPSETEKLFEQARWKTLDLLKKHLPLRTDNRHDASPDALGNLPLNERQEAFSPAPVTLPTSNVLFDSWALTSVAELPGRPPVDAWLHGEEEDADETHFAWRTEVELLRLSAMGENWLRERTKQIRELMEEYPLKSFELLRIKTSQVKDHIKKLARKSPDATVWVLGRRADPRLTTLSELAEDDYPSFAGRTIVLGPRSGGLTIEGRFDGGSDFDPKRKYDVADWFQTEQTRGLNEKQTRVRFIEQWDAESESPADPEAEKDSPIYRSIGDVAPAVGNSVNKRAVNGMTLVMEIPLEEAEDRTSRRLLFYVQPDRLMGDEAQSRKSLGTVSLAAHNAQVGRLAADWAAKLGLPADVQTAVRIAARCHDLGKDRPVWQRSIGNRDLARPLAKSGHSRILQGLEGYRHEFGSLIDVHGDSEFSNQTDDGKDLVLHLIAAHHGYGRPYFPAERAFDPQTPSCIWESLPIDVVQRFAQLQAIYGRWGLAYLESLIRSADIAASQNPDAPNLLPVLRLTPVIDPLPPRRKRVPTISVNVEPTNPGQFFACCGLLELANCIWPGAEGWFADGEFKIAASGTLTELFGKLVECHMNNSMTEAQHARFQEITAMKVKERKSTPGVEDEETFLGALLREAPIVLKAPFDMTLDWFADNYAGGSRFKTWAGRQSVLDISTAMKDALKGTAWRNENCLTFSATKCGLPFNFDSDLGAQGGAVDVGFSFDPLAGSALTRIESSARPALELLAFIGLQRFRPTEIKGQNRFLYTAWNQPLPVQVAMPAACGALPIAGANRYEFRLLYRTKYLKSFLPAIPFTGGSDE